MLIRQPYDPSKVSDEVLLDDHRIVHMWWTLAKQGKLHKYTEEDIKKLHDEIVAEMLKRGMEHKTDLYAVVHRGSEDQGRSITLEEICQAYEYPIMLKKGFVKLVGGIANHGESAGDIDLLIAWPKDAPDTIVHPVKFRLGRALHPDIASRVQFLLDEYHGPFTNHVELYDLVLQPSEDRTVVLMERLRDKEAEKQAEQSRKENKVEAGRFVIPLKGVKGYHEGEAYSIEAVADWFEDKDYPLYVQKKYDGMRCLILKKGNDVTIRSDDGTDVTKRFPTFVEMSKKLTADFTLDCEVEMWKDGKHFGREEVAGYAHRTDKPDDSNVVFNVFDVIYFYCPKFEHHELKGTVGDLHEFPYEVRYRYLETWLKVQSTMEVPKVPGFNLTPSFIANNVKELANAINKCRRAPYSEGAMVKSSKSPYPLTGLTRSWVKYKKMADVHAIVIERLPTKTEGVYNYRVGVLIPPGWEPKESEVAKVDGKEYMYIGKTFNTKELCEPGDIVTVTFHTLFHYVDEQHIKLYEPRFYEKRPDQTVPDSALDAIKVAKEAKIYQVKHVKPSELDLITKPSKWKTVAIAICGPDKSNIKKGTPKEVWTGKLQQSFMKYCEENDIPYGILSGKYGIVLSDEIVEPYDIEYPSDWFRSILVLSANIRGINKVLLYMPVFGTMKGEGYRKFREKFEEIQEPKVVACNTLEELGEHARYIRLAEPHKFVMQHHYRGQSVHIDLRIKFDDYLRGWTLNDQKPGAIKEDVETLKQAKELEKHWSKYFKSSNVPVTEAEWEKKLLTEPKEREPVEWLTVEGVVEPGEVGATKYETGVFSIIDEGTCYFGAMKPYFVELFLYGKRFNGRWVIRQLPNPWKKEQPKAEFVWLTWKPQDQQPYVLSKRAIQTKWIPEQGHSALPPEIEDKVPEKYKYWKHKDKDERIKLRDELVKSGIKLASNTFAYIHQWWRGPVQIRRGPSEERWMLLLADHTLVLSTDIIYTSETSFTLQKGIDPDLMKLTDKIDVPPGSKYNPTKATPSWMEPVDKGKSIIYEWDSNVIKFKLEGKELSGYFLGTSVKGEPVWTLTRVEGFPYLSDQ